MTETTTKPATARKTKAKTAKPVSATSKSSARRTASTAKKVSPPPAPKAPEPVVVVSTTPVVVAADMKKTDLVDLVVERSGIKKRYAKPAIEAALAILGETLAKGQGLNMQPLGKVKINRSEEKSNGRVIVCKLRQGSGGDSPKEPLAEAAE